MTGALQSPDEARCSTTSADALQRQAAAFKELLGLEDLPQTGRQAREAAQRLAGAVLPAVAPPPLLSQLVAEHLDALPPARPRFVDVSTGLRLRYLEWGAGAPDVVLLLHDLGESADSWRQLGPRLAARGYRAIALDLRGHGESGHSLEGRYSAGMVAEDVKAFIVARDLYVAPVAVVGCGMGAAAALELAQRNPFLTGAVLAAEFALPVAALQAAGAAGGSGGGAERGGGEARQALSSSRQLLPWWGFRAGQASSFPSVEHCAAFLAHPLASLAPGILEPLAQAARQAAAGAGAGTASDDAQAGAEPPLSQLLAQLHRPLRGAVAAACSLLRLPPGPAGGGGGPQFDGWDDDGGPAGLEPRMDPSLLFSFDPAALLAGLPDMRCHLLLLRGGGPGSWVDAADADATARLAAGSRAASAAAAELPGAGHWLASDHPDALLRQIVTFLEGPAIRCFERQPLPDARGGGDTAAAADGGARRPEVLGLKPLPEYASLEEAKKALGPRSIPTAAAVEEELRRLRVEEGRPVDGASSDEEGEGGAAARRRYGTALAKEPADYFGFVG